MTMDFEGRWDNTHVFEALADPTRRAVLELLRATATMTAGDLAAAFPSISRPAVSRHLRVLRQAGLVAVVKDGREWRYSLDPQPLAEVTQAWFATFAPLSEETLSNLERRAEPGEGPVGRLIVITGLPGSGKSTLATRLAAEMPAVRMSPDDWMMSSGIDLWDGPMRDRIEQVQLTLALDLLRAGQAVVIEWGVWTRAERDALRDTARAIGAPVELRYVTAPVDELWRRIVARDREGRWASRSIRRDELEEWAEAYEEPTSEELATYDPPEPT